MKTIRATGDDVTRAERRIDSVFRKIPLPAKTKGASTWHILTASEDRLRIMLMHLEKKCIASGLISGVSTFLNHADITKYAIRLALNRIFKEQNTHLEESNSFDVDPDSYIRAAELLDIAEKYHMAVAAFSSYHSGFASASKHVNKEHLVLQEAGFEPWAYALDRILLIEGEQDSPMRVIAQAFIQGPQQFDEIFEIVNRCHFYANKATYEFDKVLANHLFHLLPRIPSVVPKNWKFPWGTADESERFFHALLTRVIYHLVSIHFGSEKYFIEGGGVDLLCFPFTIEQMSHELSDYSGLDKSKSEEMLRHFTYGFKTQTPDPALQPIIPIRNNLLAAPPVHIITSNHPRNSLSLHARADVKSFDMQSHIFEEQMISKLEPAIIKRYNLFRFNSWLPKKKNIGEVDLVIIDRKSKAIFIGELRWILSPGDPREVLNRKKVCSEKVDQVARKTETAREIIPDILRSFGLAESEATSSNWHVCGAVIVEGYVTESKQPKEYPIVPIELFELALGSLNSILSIHNWLKNGEWVPQENLHYIPSGVKLKFEDQGLSWGGVRTLHNESYKDVFLKGSLSRYKEEYNQM